MEHVLGTLIVIAVAAAAVFVLGFKIPRLLRPGLGVVVEVWPMPGENLLYCVFVKEVTPGTSTTLRRGDLIAAADGINLIAPSAKEAWKRLSRVGYGPEGSLVKVEVQRGNVMYNWEVPRVKFYAA